MQDWYDQCEASSSVETRTNPGYNSVGTEVIQSDTVSTRGRSSTDAAPENKEANPVADPESNPVYCGVGTEVHQSDAACTGGGSGSATSVVEEIKANAAYPDYYQVQGLIQCQYRKNRKTSRANIADIHHGQRRYHHANDAGKEYAKIAATKGVSAYALT